MHRLQYLHVKASTTAKTTSMQAKGILVSFHWSDSSQVLSAGTKPSPTHVGDT